VRSSPRGGDWSFSIDARERLLAWQKSRELTENDGVCAAKATNL
jgi:hypothetical protein